MSVKRLFLAVWGLGLFGMGVRETVDPDMWWHLRTGEAILRAGLPQRDIFSFTVPHHPWVTHEWLAQVVMWGVYWVAGLPGLMLWGAALVVVIFAVLLAAALVATRHSGVRQPKQLYLPAFFTLWGAIASAIVWGARPQMFNLLFGAVFVWLLERVRAGAGHGRVYGWWLVGLTAVWANFHSGYLFGVVLLAVFVGSEAAQRWWQPDNAALLPWPMLRRLALATVGCFLAAALNPSGTAIWFYPFATLGSGAMQSYIQEWQPPTLGMVAFWPFFVLLVVVLLLLQRGGRKRGHASEVSAVTVYQAPFWSDGVLVLGTAVASLGSARHIPLFVLVAVPVLARLVDWRPVQSTAEGLALDRVRRWLNVGIVGVLLLAVGMWTAVKMGGNEAAIVQRYPVAAVDFLQVQGLVRGYNSYNWGGYLIWRGVPVFVDGRADVYGDPFLRLYRQTFEGQVGWERPLDDYAVQYVLIERDVVLAQLLASSPRWTEAYRDDLAQIFTRTP